MGARAATGADADEIVRLATVMFESMAVDTAASDWAVEGARQVRRRLGGDLAAFVVDHPSGDGRLVASAAGTVAHRLPGPFNPAGLAGYVQWVCVDPGSRRRGLARLVMDDLVRWFVGLGVKTIELHATPMAESLYTSMGFGESGGKALRRWVR